MLSVKLSRFQSTWFATMRNSCFYTEQALETHAFTLNKLWKLMLLHWTSSGNSCFYTEQALDLKSSGNYNVFVIDVILSMQS